MRILRFSSKAKIKQNHNGFKELTCLPSGDLLSPVLLYGFISTSAVLIAPDALFTLTLQFFSSFLHANPTKFLAFIGPGIIVLTCQPFVGGNLVNAFIKLQIN
jgi:hypothetical protein